MSTDSSDGGDIVGEKGKNRVLIVEDEGPLAEVYSIWLEDAYEVTAVTTGDAALEAIEDSFEIVLLDRQLQGWSGEELLTEFRNRGFDQPVIMITAVEPTAEIIDFPIEEYLVKPVSQDELVDTVNLVVRLTSYDGLLREYFSAISKRHSLQMSKSPISFDRDSTCRDLENRIRELETELDVAQREFDTDDYRMAFERVLR